LMFVQSSRSSRRAKSRCMSRDRQLCLRSSDARWSTKTTPPLKFRPLLSVAYKAASRRFATGAAGWTAAVGMLCIFGRRVVADEDGYHSSCLLQSKGGGLLSAIQAAGQLRQLRGLDFALRSALWGIGHGERLQAAAMCSSQGSGNARRAGDQGVWC
jgi:hypothetical protein